MPQTAAPLPWYGDPHAAPLAGTGGPHAAPVAETGERYAAARAVAAGMLHASAAFAFAAVAIGTLAALRLLASGDSRMTFDELASSLLLAGFAVGVAAALAAPNRWSTASLVTLVLAVIVSVAWPISGYRLPAALLAIVAVGLAVARDRRGASGRTRGWWPASILAGAALALSASGLAMADTYRLEPATVAAPALDAAPGPAELTATPSREPSPAATSSPDPAATPSREPSPTVVSSPDPAATPSREPLPTATSSPDPAPAPRTTASPDSTPAPGAAPSSKATPATPPRGASPAASATPPNGSVASSSPLAKHGATPQSDAAAAEDFVRGYYTALDAKRFDGAWASLSPAVRKTFGGLEKWRAGYAKTLSSRPRDVAVATEGHAVTVEHVLLARDRGCKLTRRFSVKWRLHRSSDTWTVDGLTAAALGDPRC